MPYNTQKHMQKLIDLLCESYPEGMTTGELSRAIDVTPQTIRNYLQRLGDDGVPVSEEHQRYSINPEDYFRPMRLAPAHAWLFYLSLRRIVRASLHERPLVRSLLLRVASALDETLAEYLVEPTNNAPHPSDEHLTQLVQAWGKRQWVEVHYRRLNETIAIPMRIAPLWFEPSVWTDGNYLLAAGHKQRFFTLKLDRIERVRLLEETFPEPDTDWLLERVQEAWGIWTSEVEPVYVQLRFENRVLDRLKETCWHPSQTMLIEADGRILWEARVAEPREMLPWIRSWGEDVEVLEPAWLRQEIINTLQGLVRRYGIGTDNRREFF